MSNSANPYNYVGKSHNEALESVYDQLKHLPNSPDSDTIVKSVATGLMTYYQNNTDASKSSIKEELSKDKYTHLETVSDVLASDPEKSYYSESQKQYLYRIENSIEEVNSKAELYDSLDRLVNEAKEKLSDEKAKPVLCASSVARYSFTYWDNNQGKWEDLIGVGDDADLPKVTTSGADIGGAVGGALYGAAAGGIGAGPGAVLGGGAASAGAAAQKLWDHYNMQEKLFGWCC